MLLVLWMISPQWQLLKLFFYLENEHLKHVIFISLDGTTSLRFTLTRTRLQTVAITFWDTNKKKSPVRRSEKHTITAPQARRRRRKMVFLGENFDFFTFRQDHFPFGLRPLACQREKVRTPTQSSFGSALTSKWFCRWTLSIHPDVSKIESLKISEYIFEHLEG